MTRRPLFLWTTLLLCGGMGGMSCGTDCDEVTIFVGPGEYALARLSCLDADRSNTRDFKIEGGTAKNFITPISQVYFSPDDPSDGAYWVLFNASEAAVAGNYDLDYSVERVQNGVQRLAGTAKIVVQARHEGGAGLRIDPAAGSLNAQGTLTLNALTTSGAPFVGDGRRITWVRYGFEESTSRPEYISGSPTEPLPGTVSINTEGTYRAVGIDSNGAVLVASSMIDVGEPDPDSMRVHLPGDLPERVAAGTRVTITASFENAVEPVNFDWTVNGQPRPEHTNSIEVVVDVTTTVHVTATDALGNQDEADHTFDVSAPAGFSVSILPTPGSLPSTIPPEGVRVELRAVVVGGTGPFTYHWTSVDAALAFDPPDAETTAVVLHNEADINLMVTDTSNHETTMAPRREIRRATSSGDFHVELQGPSASVTSRSTLSLVPKEFVGGAWVDACENQSDCAYLWRVTDPDMVSRDIELTYPLFAGPAGLSPTVVLRQGQFTFRVIVRRGALHSDFAELTIRVVE